MGEYLIIGLMGWFKGMIHGIFNGMMMGWYPQRCRQAWWIVVDSPSKPFEVMNISPFLNGFWRVIIDEAQKRANFGSALALLPSGYLA